MPSTQNAEIQDFPKVIVRGFGAEPKELLAGAVRGQLIEVISLDKTANICVPASDVFAFDPELFSDLADAYDTGELDEVNTLWANAQRYEG